MAVAGTSALISTAVTATTATVVTTALLVKTFVVTFALSAISRALTPKPSLDASTGLSTTVQSPVQSRPLIYGRTRTAGTLIYIQTTGDDGKYLHMVQAIAGHEIDAYEKVYIDDELLWENGSIVAKYQDNVNLNLYTGDQTTADNDLVTQSTEWDNTCILNDTAYLYIRVEYDADLFTNGIPNITALVRGKKVHDPRTGLTEWSDNPALCIADYINDDKYGLTNITINQASLIASANVCEQQVTYEIPTEPDQQHNRYALNGYVDSGDKVSSNIENMLTAMFGNVVYSQGELFINAGYYTAPVLDIDESMMVGEMTLQTKQSRRNQYNAVKGTFLSSENNYVLADYPSQLSSTYAVEDGEPIYLDMTLPFTTDNYRAQRLAKLALGKSRQQRVITVPVNLVGLKVRAGDNIRITNDKLGLNNAIYEVLDYELDYSSEMTVNLVCAETGASVYDWTVSDQQDFSVSSDVELWDGSAKPPTNLVATSVTEILSDGTTSVHIDVSWNSSSDVYLDYYVLKFGDSSLATKDTVYRIDNVDQNSSYNIEVYAYNIKGRKSTSITASVSTAPDTTAPADITPVNVADGLKQIGVYWTNPTDDDFSHVLLKVASTATEPASPVLTVAGSSYIHKVNDYNQTRYYWGAPVDRTGNVGNYTYIGSGSTTNVTIVTDEVQADNITTSADAFTSADVSLSNTYTSLQSATITVDPISKDNINASFSVNAPSACAVVFKLTKNYTFGSPPTPVSITLYESRPNTIGSGGSQFNYNLIDVQSGLSQAVTYKLEAKITTTLTGVVARDRSLSAVDIKR